MVPKKVLFCRLYLALLLVVCARSAQAPLAFKRNYIRTKIPPLSGAPLGGANPGVLGVRGVGARF